MQKDYLPRDQNILVSKGDEMEKLLSHYEKDHTDIYNGGGTLHQSADLVTDKVLAE